MQGTAIDLVVLVNIARTAGRAAGYANRNLTLAQMVACANRAGAALQLTESDHVVYLREFGYGYSEAQHQAR